MGSLLIVLGVLFFLSLVPLVFLLVRSYLRYRGVQAVTCPATGSTAKVRLDAGKAAFSSVSGGPNLLVTSCEHWPEHKDCTQGCVAEGASEPHQLLHAEAKT
jgi:hypothetical protein